MGNRSKDPARLGLFVLASVALLLVALYVIGSKRNLFSSTVSVEAVFRQVGGLRPGSSVRYMGIHVGTVDRITILNDSAVLVVMGIRTKDAGHILTSTVATLGTDGLMGSRLSTWNRAGRPGVPDHRWHAYGHPAWRWTPMR
jgi:ABC-type transport system involved in resistance to organic solvents, periplasmic component